MKSCLAVCKTTFLLCVILSGSSSAQWGYAWDSVLVSNIKVCYPTQPNLGSIRAELWWYHPGSPGSVDPGNIAIWLVWSETAYCDSVKNSSGWWSDSVYYNVDIDDAARLLWYSIDVDPNNPFLFPPGHYHLADIYFRCFGTGLFTTDSLKAPYFARHPISVYWLGRQFRSENLIANPGDFDASGEATISDCVYLLNYIFGDSGSPVPCADADGNCLLNISDAVYLIDYIFASGPGPGLGCCSWIE